MGPSVGLLVSVQILILGHDIKPHVQLGAQWESASDPPSSSMPPPTPPSTCTLGIKTISWQTHDLFSHNLINCYSYFLVIDNGINLIPINHSKSNLVQVFYFFDKVLFKNSQFLLSLSMFYQHTFSFPFPLLQSQYKSTWCLLSSIYPPRKHQESDCKSDVL